MPIHIGYQPSQNLGVRRTIRRVALVAIVLSTALMSYRFGPGIHHWYVLRHWERSWRNYVAPADQIVFSNVPEREAGIDGNADIALHGGRACMPEELRKVQELAYYNYRDPQALLYMHERRSRNGKRWTVVVSFRSRKVDSNRESCAFRTDVFIPLSFSSGYIQRGNKVAALELIPSRLSTGLTFYAGQSDATDDAAFSIPYDRDGSKGAVSGVVTDDGELHLSIKTGPLARE